MPDIAASTKERGIAPILPPAPPRPDGVPRDARWDPVGQIWEHGFSDGGGSRQGEWRSWRADGRLLGVWACVDHEPHGPNRRFHPDGTVSSEGSWKDGLLHDCVYFRAAGETDEAWIAEGGPLVVRALYASSDGRSSAAIRFFDADGLERDRAGALVPPRPAGVPETARYFSDEESGSPDGSAAGWVDGRIERATQAKLGTWRWWSSAGALLRTERFSERGRLLASVPAGGPDPVDDLVARFLAGEDVGLKLGRVWTPALHERIRADLASRPAAVTRAYIHLLQSNIQEGHRIWRVERPQPRLIVAVVSDWEARSPADAADVEAWYLLGAGLRAAYEVRDRERLARWWRRFEAFAAPAPFPEGTLAFPFLSRDLAGEVGAAIRAAVDGSEAAAMGSLASALASPATAAQVSDEDLARFAAVTIGCARCETMIRDRDTGEAWFHDAENRSHYFDGRVFAPPTVVFDDRARHDADYVAPYRSCDERVLLWPGKHGWLALQRYGRAVLWHSARFVSDRGQAEVDRIVWFKAASPAAASRMMRLIRAGRPKAARPIDPWFDKKLGVIARVYSGKGLTRLGVDDDALTRGELLIERLGSRAEAIVAFEQIEIERMRSGSILERLTAELAAE